MRGELDHLEGFLEDQVGGGVGGEGFLLHHATEYYLLRVLEELLVLGLDLFFSLLQPVLHLFLVVLLLFQLGHLLGEDGLYGYRFEERVRFQV